MAMLAGERRENARMSNYTPPGVERRERRERVWGELGWGTYYGKEHGVMHECEDGHYWIVQPDGGVSPSWGFGLTSIRYEQPTDRCPEPERGHSIYEDGGPDHGYRCPTCGTVHYVGGCGPGVACGGPYNDDEPCAPPPPACGKPAVRTLRWLATVDPVTKVVHGWVDLEPQPGEQLTLA